MKREEFRKKVKEEVLQKKKRVNTNLMTEYCAVSNERGNMKARYGSEHSRKSSVKYSM